MNKFGKLSLGIVSSFPLIFLFAGSSYAQSYNQGLARWPYQTDAKCYQIFYKESTATNWQFSVRCRDLKNPAWEYTIKYLKPGVTYIYKVKEISNIGGPNQYPWITNDAELQLSPQPQS